MNMYEIVDKYEKNNQSTKYKQITKFLLFFELTDKDKIYESFKLEDRDINEIYILFSNYQDMYRLKNDTIIGYYHSLHRFLKWFFITYYKISYVLPSNTFFAYIANQNFNKSITVFNEVIKKETKKIVASLSNFRITKSTCYVCKWHTEIHIYINYLTFNLISNNIDFHMLLLEKIKDNEIVLKYSNNKKRYNFIIIPKNKIEMVVVL